MTHLAWLPVGALVGFGASFVFGDLVTLPVDVYYLMYFGIVLGFLVLYVKRTELELSAWISPRLGWGVGLGVLGGIVLMQGVLARPETARLSGGMLAWAVAWRGVAYGAVDGLLLFAFPWMVVWRAFEAREAGWGVRLRAGAVAVFSILLVTTIYHLGYADFRSRKIVQPNIGSAIGAVPTLVTANPLASPLSHVFLHVTAVIHSPETDLFLPPHRGESPTPSHGIDPTALSTHGE
jgi:hypothetical protein